MAETETAKKNNAGMIALGIFIFVLIIGAIIYFVSSSKKAPATTTVTSSTSGLSGLNLGSLIGGIGSILGGKTSPTDSTPPTFYDGGIGG